eukprot:s275_g32.t3
MVAWGGRGGLVSRGALLALCHSDFTSWRVEAGEKGNGLCWYNSDRTYLRCCIGEDPDCWQGIWITRELCCYPLTEQSQRCFDSIEEKVEAKIKALRDFQAQAEDAELDDQTLPFCGAVSATAAILLKASVRKMEAEVDQIIDGDLQSLRPQPEIVRTDGPKLFWNMGGTQLARGGDASFGTEQAAHAARDDAMMERCVVLFVPFIDAKFVESTTLPPMALDLERFLKDEGLFAPRLSAEDFELYKYQIALEGNSATDRLAWQLFMGSVVLIPDQPWQVMGPLRMLQPWVHFVPLSYDLSDLVDRLQWLISHDPEAKAIAQNGVAFAHRHLTCDDYIHYIDRLLRAYAKKLHS